MSESRQVPFLEIAAHLRQLAAAMAPGEKLPSQAELKRQFRVTHVTVGRAYAQLIKEGAVEAVQYKGYFVRGRSRLVWDRTRSLETATMAGLPREESNSPVDTWSLDAQAAGYSSRQQIRVEILSARIAVGPYTLAELLQIDPDQQAIGRLRVRYIGAHGQQADTPESLARSYYPRDVVADSAIENPASVNTARVLSELGHPLAGEAREEVWQRIATAEEIQLLGLPDVTAVVDVIHVRADDQGRPVLAQHIVTSNPLRYNLTARQ